MAYLVLFLPTPDHLLSFGLRGLSKTNGYYPRLQTMTHGLRKAVSFASHGMIVFCIPWICGYYSRGEE